MASQDGVGWPDESTGFSLASARDESRLAAEGTWLAVPATEWRRDNRRCQHEEPHSERGSRSGFPRGYWGGRGSGA